MSKQFFKKILTSRELILTVLIIIIFSIYANQSEVFLSHDNLKALLFSISTYAIIAVGMTILFVSGGFDMSTGTHIAFIGTVLGILLSYGVPVFLTIIIILILGIIDGSILGVLVSKFKIDPFIVTLGAMLIFQGTALLLGINSPVRTEATHGVPMFSNFSESFLSIGRNTIFGIENPTYFMIIITIILGMLLSQNVFFRKNWYIGGNEAAAKLSGIKVDFIKIFNYALVSFLVAIATILRVSRIGTASAISGGVEPGIMVIVAVILGGASLSGGKGSIIGSVLGVILIFSIQNGLVILAVNPFYANMIVGLILLGAVFADVMTNKNENTIS